VGLRFIFEMLSLFGLLERVFRAPCGCHCCITICNTTNGDDLHCRYTKLLKARGGLIGGSANRWCCRNYPRREFTPIPVRRLSRQLVLDRRLRAQRFVGSYVVVLAAHRFDVLAV